MAEGLKKITTYMDMLSSEVCHRLFDQINTQVRSKAPYEVVLKIDESFDNLLWKWQEEWTK